MIAESQNFDSEEGLQKANKKLQFASGVFSSLKDRVVGLMEQDPTPDLEPTPVRLCPPGEPATLASTSLSRPPLQAAWV